MAFLNNLFGKNRKDDEIGHDNDDEVYIAYDDEDEVYISYNAHDEAIANDIYKSLGDVGISRCFSNIKKSKLVIVLYSRYFDNIDDLDTAFFEDIPILVFRLDESEFRRECSSYLINQPTIDAFPNLQDKFEELCNVSLKALNKKVQNPPIYISYSSADERIASRVCDFLESYNLKCWIAPRDIKTGKNYADEIANGIKNAKIQVIVTSKNSLNSKFVENEINMGFVHQKPILVFNVDGSSLNMTLQLKITNFINVRDNISNSFDMLLGDICKLLNISKEKVLANHGSPNDEIEDGEIEKPFVAYEGEEKFIFVSYAHKDREIVFPEIKKFHDEGYPIWYDDGLTAGQEWDEEIEEVLMDSSLLVVFISKNSMASTNVVDEIKLALDEKIDVVPIYLEETKLAKGLKLRLSNKHAIFKHKLSENSYLKDCFKAFKKAEIPKIEFDD